LVLKALYSGDPDLTRSPSEESLASVRQLADAKLRSALLFYLADGDERVQLLETLPEAERRFLFRTVSRPELVDALQECPAATRERLESELPRAGRTRATVAQMGFEAAVRRPINNATPVREVVTEILSGRSITALPECRPVVSALFQVLNTHAERRVRAIDPVFAVGSLMSRLKYPLTATSKAGLKALVKTFDQRCQTKMRDSLLANLAEKQRTFAFDLLKCLQQSGALDVLLHKVLGKLEEEEANHLIRKVAAGQTPMWVTLLKRLRKAKEKVDPALITAIVGAGPKTIIRATSACPEAFSAIAVSALPLRGALPLAFRLPWVGAAMEEKYTRDELIAQAPWVRRRWAAWPDLAAAYELALAASLRDANYLRTIVHESASSPGQRFDRLYRTYDLPKKSGGKRIITAPQWPLRRLQRRLLDGIFASVGLHPAATGFRPGVSIVDNASVHVGQLMIVNVDIKSFFPSTPHALILSSCARVTKDLLSDRACRLLADLCSYDGALPTGAPTSPTLANIILEPIDRSISLVCQRAGVRYTRYADDMTFSGGRRPQSVLPFVSRVLGQLGYSLDPKKTNLFRRGRRQIVTGLVVNDKPNLPRKLRRRLRAAVHARCNGQVPVWQGHQINDSQLWGHIAMLNLVQPEEAGRLWSRLRVAPKVPGGAAV
jgi:retron-type reverse transcriptase